MNASSEKFANHRSGRFGLAMTACLMLSACGTQGLLSSSAIDPSSKVADQVAALVKEGGDYPTFAGIPPVPTDQRALRAWGESAGQIEALGSDLERATAEGTWSLSGTERFAARSRSQIDMAPSLAASTAAETEAFARALRKRATPPPPPKR